MLAIIQDKLQAIESIDKSLSKQGDTVKISEEGGENDPPITLTQVSTDLML